MESYMAELRQQVQCSLCNETMIEPKLLQCFHTFCKPCIKRHAQLDGQVNIFKCPQCTSQTLLQELDDVDDLQINPIHSKILQVLFFIENQKVCSVSTSHCEALWQCLVCDRSLCDECLGHHSEFTKDHKVVSLSELKKEDIEVMLKRESPCQTHTNQDVELHCQDCVELICLVCWKECHKSHNTVLLKEFIDTKNDFLSKNLQEIQKLSTNEDEMKQQEEIALFIQTNGEKAQKHVKKVTKTLMKALIDHEQQLLDEIQNDITSAGTNLRIIRHAPAAQEYITSIINNGTASDIINGVEIDSRNDLIYNPFPNDSLGSAFCPNEELLRQVTDGLGKIQSLKKADHNMSSFNVESNMEAMKKGKLTLVLKTSKRETAHELLDNVTIEITPEESVQVEEKQVTADGEITVDCTPLVAVQLTVQVTVHGNHVTNSPQLIAVEPQLLKEMTAHSKLKEALNTGSNVFTGIAVNKTNSKIAVADFPSHCVRVFNMEGDLLLTYGSHGSGQGQLNTPQGLAFLNETDLVIAERDKHRISIISTATRKLIRTFGCQGNGNGQLNAPYGVYADADSNIIVCDSNNHRLQVFTKDGDYQYQLSFPNGRGFHVIQHDERFYVSNYDTSAIHVIEMEDDQSPTTVTIIDGKNYNDGQLQKPYGLSIDNDNNLLVCDRSSSMIYKFTLDGRLIAKSRQFTNMPTYITVLNDGRVICATEGGGVFFY